MIKINDLKFSYGNDLVLNNITTSLESGRIYGLLGENGVGKTTLLTLLCGLKKPQEGAININGYIPYDRDPRFLSDICYLPDEVAPVHDFPLHWASVTGRFWPGFDMEIFKAIMDEFSNPVNHKMDEMSNGQLKKCYISFTLATKAGTILMDEPTNGLDIPSKAQFRKAMMAHTDEKATIVISTHQVRDLENIIDPVVILDRKDVLLNASVEEITSRLYFDYGTAPNPESLYSEQLPGGFIQVYVNASGKESKVNIEALFNAAYNNKTAIKGLFSK